MIGWIEILAALAIGIALGLVGGGGSILTVPVFVYLMGIDPVRATAYSLFVVGATSLVGSYTYLRQGMVNMQIVALFGIPSVIFIYLTRRFLLPAIPESIGQIGDLLVTKGIFLMLLLAVLMVAAAISMIFDPPVAEGESKKAVGAKAILALIGQGALVGVLTGLVGAGGGFLTIPVLILFSRVNMKVAVGTSLFIAGVRSLIGFASDKGAYEIDWQVLLIFTALAIVGIFIGGALARKIPSAGLKKGFGWFVLIMALAILAAELLA